MSFFHTLDRFADLIESLTPGGYLFVEGHLRSATRLRPVRATTATGSAANELLRAPGSG